MSRIRFMVTGDTNVVSVMMDAIESIEGVTRVEQVADLMPHLDDPDSSSAGLNADGGSKVYAIEVEVRDASTARRVEVAAENAAMAVGAVLEMDSSGA